MQKNQYVYENSILRISGSLNILLSNALFKSSLVVSILFGYFSLQLVLVHAGIANYPIDTLFPPTRKEKDGNRLEIIVWKTEPIWCPLNRKGKWHI